MDSITNLNKSEIKRQYGGVAKAAEAAVSSYGTAPNLFTFESLMGVQRFGFILHNIVFTLLLLIMILCVTIATADRPTFDGHAYVDIDGYNFPEDIQQISGNQLFQLNFSPLDQLGRPGTVSVIITQESLNGQIRESIAQIIPTGFEQAKYPFIDQEFLYQRCHLIGSQFKGETEIPENIVTGTHFMNLNGMYSLENQVSSYVLTTGNSVYYCAIPDFEGDELVCRGVTIAAVALAAPEEFHIAKYCFNVQPGVLIDYSTGYSTLAETSGTVEIPWTRSTIETEAIELDYILNKKTFKFHYPNCSGVASMKENNKQEFHGTREMLIEMGYSPCGTCNP